jgi:hypothetical protein
MSLTMDYYVSRFHYPPVGGLGMKGHFGGIGVEEEARLVGGSNPILPSTGPSYIHLWPPMKADEETTSTYYIHQKNHCLYRQ